MQDNLRVKETQWGREKEEYLKNLKTQESLLQKLTTDRTHFETRWILGLTLRAIHDIVVPVFCY